MAFQLKTEAALCRVLPLLLRCLSWSCSTPCCSLICRQGSLGSQPEQTPRKCCVPWWSGRIPACYSTCVAGPQAMGHMPVSSPELWWLQIVSATPKRSSFLLPSSLSVLQWQPTCAHSTRSDPLSCASPLSWTHMSSH